VILRTVRAHHTSIVAIALTIAIAIAVAGVVLSTGAPPWARLRRPPISALLDGALGPHGHYGVFTANMHTDKPDNPGADAIVAEARARGVPVVSAKQMLAWLDGRNGSSFRGLSYTRGRLRFAVAPAAGARGLEAMVPARAATGGLMGLTRNGARVDVTPRTVKGIDYEMFDADAGGYVATYPRGPSPN
jgi:hypothetical protein